MYTVSNFPLFLLDSGDPDEFREISQLAKKQGQQLWSATTNPSLIAKKLAGKKVSLEKAFELQKEIVLEIISIVPGAVSTEVYADNNTSADEMITQGKDIATWHDRVIVKLPTTIEGFKARSALRKENIPINNTLVFSQEQIFAICLHEQIMNKTLATSPRQKRPCFISPFVGRLDDIGIDGMQLVEHGMKIKQIVFEGVQTGTPWMLAASIRRVEHIQRSLDYGSELITAPAKVYREWFPFMNNESRIMNNEYAKGFAQIPYWEPPNELLEIQTEDGFFEAISSSKLNIQHDLTDKGIDRFAKDWQTIIA